MSTMSTIVEEEKSALINTRDDEAKFTSFLQLGDPQAFINFESQAEEDISALQKDLQQIRDEYLNPASPFSKVVKTYRDNTEEWADFTLALESHAKVWQKIHPLAFVRNVSVLGHRLPAYLNLLSVDLEEWPAWKKNWKTVLQSYRFKAGDSHLLETIFPMAGSDGEPNEVQECCQQRGCPIDLSKIEQERSKNEGKLQMYLRYLSGVQSEHYQTHWTSLSQLLEPQDPNHKVFIMKALYNTGGDSTCFNSLASRCILDTYWNSLKWGYFRKIGFSVIFLCALAANTAWIMYVGDHHSPPLIMTRITGVLALASVLGPITDFILHIYFFQQAGIVEFFTFWNMSTVVVEIMVVAFLGPVLWLNNPSTDCEVTGPDLEPGPGHDCSFVQHSVAYMIAIAVKWMHLILECMCIEFFGKSVLPAFSAITGAEARKFMVFLGLIVAASFQAYWSLPIPDNQPRDGTSHLWKSFTSVFRLDILGEYDVWELEGVHDQFNKSTKDNIAEIDEGLESQLYHDGIQIMGTFLTCFVAVGMMNVSIGVLGRAYEENKAQANQIYCNFKAGYAFKFLQRQVAHQQFKESFCQIFCCGESARASNEIKSPGPLKGLLLRFNRGSYIDHALDYTETLEGIEGRLTRLEENDKRLQEVFNVIKFQLERLTGKDLGKTALATPGSEFGGSDPYR